MPPSPSPVVAYPVRPLKTASLADIEQAFAEALHRLTGAEYQVELEKLDFGEGFTMALFDTSHLTLKVSRQATDAVSF